jgi:ABC-type nickel/cobalt efflux system permease component RcnA
LYVTGIIQTALAVALLVAALAAFRAVQAHAQDVEATLRYALPGMFVFGALVTARSALRNLRMAQRERAGDRGEPPSGG